MYSYSQKSSVARAKDRAAYDKGTVNSILDAGKLCHVAFTFDEQPFVIPMVYARQGQSLILHGSPKSRLMQALSDQLPVCISVTHLDGLVLARSTFHHSVNYRSVVLFGHASAIDDAKEKAEALALLTEHLTPGRTASARPPSSGELKGTSVVRFNIEEASAKIRTGPPKDDPEDMKLDVWAGVIPLIVTEGEPQPSPDLKPGIDFS